jgi:hypothetical protein
MRQRRHCTGPGMPGLAPAVQQYDGRRISIARNVSDELDSIAGGPRLNHVAG